MERVGQSLKLTDRKDLEKEEIIKGRAVCTELFQALKYAASKHHDPSDPNKTKVLKHIYVVDMKNVKTIARHDRAAEIGSEHHADHGAKLSGGRVADLRRQCAKIPYNYLTKSTSD